MKQIWAPWRMTYIDQGTKAEACIFCTLYRETDLRAALVLAQTEHSTVILNRYPYNNGHLLLAPKRHESDPTQLSAQQFTDLNELLCRSIEIIRQALHPDGMNLGMNLGKCAGAGIADHLHWHVVPRWEGDSNFMPVVAETRVMPQHLLDGYDRLKPMFQVLGG